MLCLRKARFRERAGAFLPFYALRYGSCASIRVVDFGTLAIDAAARHLVVWHKRVSCSCRDNAFEHSACFRAVNIIVAAHCADLISSALIVSKSSDTLGVSLRSSHILGFQVANTRNWVGQSTGIVAFNFTVGVVDAG